MKSRSFPVHLFLFLATAVVAGAQQPPLPALSGHPLYGTAATASASAGPSTASTDPRVLDFTSRLKSTFDQVRAENPAVLPASIASAARAGQVPAATNLRQRAGSDVKIRMRHEMGTPRYIEGGRLERAAVSATAPGGVDDVATARNFFRANRSLLQLQDPDVELAVQKSQRDETGRRHLRYEQRHRGLRVYPAELSVHLDNGGNVYLMTGAYVPTPEVALKQPKISPDDAVYRAASAPTRPCAKQRQIPN